MLKKHWNIAHLHGLWRTAAVKFYFDILSISVKIYCSKNER